MDELKKEVIITALKNMFKPDGFFSICTLEELIKISGAIPDQEDIDLLHPLHCIHWTDMSPELRQMVFNKTIAMISCEGFDLSVLDMIFDKKKKIFEIEQPKKRKFKLLG